MTQVVNRDLKSKDPSNKICLVSTFQTEIIPSKDLIFKIRIKDELNDKEERDVFSLSQIELDFEQVILEMTLKEYFEFNSHIKEFNSSLNKTTLQSLIKMFNRRFKNSIKITDVDGILEGNALI